MRAEYALCGGIFALWGWRIGSPTSGVSWSRRRGWSERKGRVFNVKNTDFSVAGSGNDGTVVGMWHKLDGENVVLVAGFDAGGEGETGVCGVDVDAVVIRSGSKESTAGGPS